MDNTQNNNFEEPKAKMNQQQAQQEQAQMDIEDGTEEIFPGGPSKEQIENWKKQYGDIYMTEFDSETFVWRTLTRYEFKKVVNVEGSENDWFREEQVSETCVLYPEDYTHDDMSQGKAGIPAMLADQIMNKSGFMPKTGAQKL